MRTFFNICRFLELLHLQNRVFHTFQVTLLKRSNLKTLQSKFNIVKSMCACFREKYQIILLSTFDQGEFKKIILTKMCKGCEKGHFLPFLHPLHIFVKLIYFFKFTLIKSTQWNHLRFFRKACTCIFNNINFRLQGLQIKAFQQRYLKCNFETPYFEGELVPKNCKNWKMSSKNCTVWFSHWTRESIRFWEEFMKNQLKLMVSKKVADQSHFGSNIESLF